MRNSMIFAALAACVAMGSCTKENLTSVKSEKEIAFTRPIVSKNTKAVSGELGTTYDKAESFKVWAKHTPAEFVNTGWSAATMYMNAVSVSFVESVNDATLGSGAWKATQKYYWPKEGKLTFAALSPADLSGVDCTEEGFTITDYKINNSSTRQYTDILYSDRVTDKTSSLGGISEVYDGVDIPFHHALSSVWTTVKAKESYEDVTITLLGVEFTTIASKGTFAQGLKDKTVSGNAEWSNTSENITYVAFEGSQEVSAKMANVNGNTAKTGDSALILLPQTIDNAAELKITYSIKSATGDPITQVTSKTLKTPAVGAWEMGKRYTYNIIIGLDEVYFAPSVDSWVDVAGQDVNIQ